MFPTCVGMNRRDDMYGSLFVGVPHMRGDEPVGLKIIEREVKCSPHAWG